MLPAFTSTIILLIGVWGGKKSGMQDGGAALGDVNKCLNALKQAEVWWRGAGRMRCAKVLALTVAPLFSDIS